MSNCSFDYVLTSQKHMIFPDRGIRDVILPENSVHFCPAGHWKKPVWTDHYHEMSSIIFFPEFIRLTYIDFNRPSQRAYSFEAAHTYYHTQTPMHEAGWDIINSMKHMIKLNLPLTGLENLFKTLMIMTYDVLKNDRLHPRSKRDATYIAIKQYLYDNFQRPINRKSVAKHFGINPSYLSQLFAEKEPDGFIGLLRNIRLEQAALLLVNTSMSIDEITFQCGYFSTSYFISQFKKKYKNSPGRYRLMRS